MLPSVPSRLVAFARIVTLGLACVAFLSAPVLAENRVEGSFGLSNGWRGGAELNDTGVLAHGARGLVLGGWHHLVVSPLMRVVSSLVHGMGNATGGGVDEDSFYGTDNAELPATTLGSLAVRYDVKDSVDATLGVSFDVGGDGNSAASAGIGTAF